MAASYEFVWTEKGMLVSFSVRGVFWVVKSPSPRSYVWDAHPQLLTTLNSVPNTFVFYTINPLVSTYVRCFLV